MFTGLIREFGKVEKFENSRLKISCKHRANVGDSIAINGACLSATKIFSDGFEVELSSESKDIVAIENIKNLVHIEPAMRLSDRVEGHLIQGHIDCVGKISKIEKRGVGVDFYIEIPKEHRRFMIPKGSVAIDGVSLTINELLADCIRLTIIPLTLKSTLFDDYKVGRRVNIESDMITRSIYYLFKENKESIKWEDIDKMSALY